MVYKRMRDEYETAKMVRIFEIIILDFFGWWCNVSCQKLVPIHIDWRREGSETIEEDNGAPCKATSKVWQPIPSTKVSYLFHVVIWTLLMWNYSVFSDYEYTFFVFGVGQQRKQQSQSHQSCVWIREEKGGRPFTWDDETMVACNICSRLLEPI